jgi:pimeloyl-ACP methyl ester carboxylesterase
MALEVQMKAMTLLGVSVNLLMLAMNVACGLNDIANGARQPAASLNPDLDARPKQTPVPEVLSPRVPTESSDSEGKSVDPVPSSATCSIPVLPANNTFNVQYQSIKDVDVNSQSLDVYMPVVKDPCKGVPVVIWVHGGAWMLGDKSAVGAKAALFNSLGYGFVSVNYRLSPNLKDDPTLNPARIQFPIHPTDVGAAVAWVHQNIKKLGGDAQRLALMGHSAGAHLAALVALDQRYIKRADSNWNPKSLRCLGSYDTEAYDVRELMRQASGQSLLIYRNAFGDESAVWEAASPINFVSEYGMSVQLAKRGEGDRQAQLEQFKSALMNKSNGVSVIDAAAYSHTEVNQKIGVAGEQVMTPAVTKFVQQSCFAN